MAESGRLLSPPVPPRPALTGGYTTRAHSRFSAITTALTAPAADCAEKGRGWSWRGGLRRCLMRGRCPSLCWTPATLRSPWALTGARALHAAAGTALLAPPPRQPLLACCFLPSHVELMPRPQAAPKQALTDPNSDEWLGTTPPVPRCVLPGVGRIRSFLEGLRVQEP